MRLKTRLYIHMVVNHTGSFPFVLFAVKVDVPRSMILVCIGGWVGGWVDRGGVVHVHDIVTSQNCSVVHTQIHKLLL